ncbi:MAG: hypothetical protein K8S25_17875 [Alphaproteobacteria bacterium]|nr:hypothetical protein [Alphaproteobacteria bacterium]
MIDRRSLLVGFAGVAALNAIYSSGALSAAPLALDHWAQDVADLNRDLAAAKISLIEWQDRIAALDTGVNLAELRRYLDFDRLTKAMAFPTNLAETADPKFPASINVAGIERAWFIRFFGMRKGGAIIPHVHNNMVSAHLVIEGQFHARTFDRVQDLPEEKAVLLRPKLDRAIKPGDAISMSDDRDNGHWLIAEADRSFTFDVGVLGLSKTRTFGLKADDYSMIFVDPTAKPETTDLVRAPTLSFGQCQARFAP